jgi:methyl-accepting chemotaxis protein
MWLASLWGPFSDQTGLAFPRSARIEDAELPAGVISLISALLIHTRDDHVCRDAATHWRALQSGGESLVWPVTPVGWGWLAEIDAQNQATQLTLMGERRAFTSERDALASERDALASERDALASELALLSSDRDAVGVERDRLASQLEALRSERDDLAVEGDRLHARLAATEAQVARTLATWSWRCTRPLRSLRSAFRKS